MSMSTSIDADICMLAEVMLYEVPAMVFLSDRVIFVGIIVLFFLHAFILSVGCIADL